MDLEPERKTQYLQRELKPVEDRVGVILEAVSKRHRYDLVELGRQDRSWSVKIARLPDEIAMWNLTSSHQRSRAGRHHGSDLTGAAWVLILPSLPAEAGCGRDITDHQKRRECPRSHAKSARPASSGFAPGLLATPASP